MAKTLMLKLTTILFLLGFLLLAMHVESTPSFEDEENEDEDYILDSVLSNTTTVRRSRFLASAIKKITKGTTCDARKKRPVCNGLWTDKGKSRLYCCKNHCRDVLSDQNNCGRCGHKCRLGQRCCGGTCTNVLWNNANCGKCGKKCRRGVKCQYGFCGYA